MTQPTGGQSEREALEALSIETLSLEEGKYELRRRNGVLTAHRHGEPWRDCTGDKLINALMDAALVAEEAKQTESAVPSRCATCGNGYLAIRTDIYKDGREFVYCDACGALADRKTWARASQASAPQPSPAEHLQREMTLMEARDGLRTALEVIALGDSKNPQEDAAKTLVELGLWSAEAVSAEAHRAPSPAEQTEQAPVRETCSGPYNRRRPCRRCLARPGESCRLAALAERTQQEPKT